MAARATRNHIAREISFDERVRRGVAKRGAFPYVAGMTLLIALGAGLLVRLIDHRDFSSFGMGVWWALQTVTTVGYGDVVPRSTWGRVVGGCIMALGITFLSFLTATVTSLFVSTEQREMREDLRRIDERLANIEAALQQRR